MFHQEDKKQDEELKMVGEGLVPPKNDIERLYKTEIAKNKKQLIGMPTVEQLDASPSRS